MFFAYLRSLAPNQQTRGAISLLPTSLLKLLQETEYPPQRPALMQSSTNRVAMIVDTVSPTPFALLRRANHFQYRDEDRALREFAEYEDPVSALTEECRRVLRAVSAANQSKAVSSSKHSTSLRDASWSRFEDIGFASALEEEDEEDESKLGARRQQGLRSSPASGLNMGRPTTPSWADFLSSGFVDENNKSSNMLLPPDKVLPPIETAVRQRSSQSHRPRLETEPQQLEPGELASITRFDLDDAFWWVWMSSLAPEETPERKAAFGRCAVIETVIRTGRWLVMEEIVKGAAPDIEEGAYIAEKKGFFSWTRRGKSGLSRRKSTGKHALDRGESMKAGSNFSKTSIAPDQQARIQAAALQLQMREKQQSQPQPTHERRGRNDSELMAEKTNSVMTLQPSILTEASPAVKWANKYDKEAIREAYLSNTNAGRGAPAYTNGHSTPSTNGYDRPPELPPKSMGYPASPSIRPATPELEPQLTEKSLEAPRDIHPAERSADAGRSSPLPPPKDVVSLEQARDTMASSEPDSPESKKQKKLHKDVKPVAAATAAPVGGGFRKLFGRNKIRQSKLPDNAASQVNAMLAADEKPSAPTPAPLQAVSPDDVLPQFEHRVEEPVSPPQSPPVAKAAPVSPVMAPVHEPVYEPPVYEPEVQDAISRVSTRDAREATAEFARFDQGPLADQPAFIPHDAEDDDDATPPPIARHATRSPLPSPTAQAPAPAPGPAEEEESSAPPPPPVARAAAAEPPLDRWAQIRKNAAERAAKRQAAPEELKKPVEMGDDTSSEESKSPAFPNHVLQLLTVVPVAIESRVARIKARVAELTSSAEGINGPGNRTPPPIRR